MVAAVLDSRVRLPNLVGNGTVPRVVGRCGSFSELCDMGIIVQVTNIATGETHVAHIVHGSSSAGIYGDDRGMSWWASGVQWTRTIGPHQTAPKTHTCTVIKTTEQVRQERQKEQLMKVAQMIYDGVKSGSYSVENVAETIIYLR